MYLTSDDVRSNLKAAPGWLIIEPVETASEVKSAGGIIVPQNDEVNMALIKVGRVVSCGEHYHQQSGATKFHGWPLNPGAYLYYHPHNEWTLKSTQGGRFIVIKSIDVMAYWE